MVKFERRPWRNPENGKPFFPLGWFVYDSDEADLDEIAGDGGNAVIFIQAMTSVRDDATVEANIPRMRKYLDHAHKRGIKVLMNAQPWLGGFKENDAVRIARARKLIESFKDHPALLGYQLYDEPEYLGQCISEPSNRDREALVATFRRMRESIREWDGNPHRTVQVVFNVVPYEGQEIADWRQYLPVIDSFQIDRYPLDSSQAYFGHRGDWGPLIMAWSMAHGAARS